MEGKKENKSVWLIILILVLIIATGFTTYQLVKQEKSLNKETENEYKKVKLMENNFGGNYGKNVELKYSSTKNKVEDKIEKSYADGFQVDENGERYNAYNIEDKSYFCEYSYGTGKLYIDGKEIITDKVIKYIASGTNYDVTMFESVMEIGEEYNYTSTLYILFEDGTLGKIDTNDIKNKNYDVTILDGYENEEYFLEAEPIGFGGDTNLYVVDINGISQKVGMIISGS